MKNIHFNLHFHSPLAGAIVVFTVSTPIVPWNLTVVNFHFNIDISIILTWISLWKCKLSGFTRNLWQNRLQLRLFWAFAKNCQHFVGMYWEITACFGYCAVKTKSRLNIKFVCCLAVCIRSHQASWVFFLSHWGAQQELWLRPTFTTLEF